MPISDKHKTVFIHVPKNAGTAVMSGLDMYEIGHHSWHHYRDAFPEKWSSYQKFAIIRNPWDRFVSCYEYARMAESYWHSVTGKARYKAHPDYGILKDMSFEDTVNMFFEKRIRLNHQGWSLQKDYIVDSSNNIMVDFLIDYKNINSEIKTRFDVELPIVNKSDRLEYKSYYNESTIEKISKIYKEDIKIFNFTYE